MPITGSVTSSFTTPGTMRLEILPKNPLPTWCQLTSESCERLGLTGLPGTSVVVHWDSGQQKSVSEPGMFYVLTEQYIEKVARLLDENVAVTRARLQVLYAEACEALLKRG